MNNNEDIWSGGSIRKTTDGEKYDEWYVQRMINSAKSYHETSTVSYALAFAFFVLLMAFFIGLSVMGPSMWHDALVVCNGGNCTTYTEWKVIGENPNTGVLEVWAGGRLQRLSNGTWHYE